VALWIFENWTQSQQTARLTQRGDGLNQ